MIKRIRLWMDEHYPFDTLSFILLRFEKKTLDKNTNGD